MKVKPQKTDRYSAEGDASSEDIARRLKLDKGLGFLVRLLDTHVNVLHERLTAQNDITPRQFGVLLTLYQQGTHRGDGSHNEHRGSRSGDPGRSTIAKLFMVDSRRRRHC